MNEAMNYDDYIKLRDAKIGDVVKLSDGRVITKSTNRILDNNPRKKAKPSKNQNLDFYDQTYEG